MRCLLLDIETAPNLAFVWSLWKETVNIDRIVNSGYVLSWAAKWLGESQLHYDSLHKSKPVRMLDRIHRLLDESDAVIHYNGKTFDIPTLQKEFVLHKMPPPAPYKQVDLLQIVKAEFRFPSNKLDYVAQALGLGNKVRHPGFQMWVDCMNGKATAWKQMEEYNKQDVVLLERLYERLLPWIKIHPNHGAFGDVSVCPNCGSDKFRPRGFAITLVMKYQRYLCDACGTWFRGNKSVGTCKERHLPIVG